MRLHEGLPGEAECTAGSSETVKLIFTANPTPELGSNHGVNEGLDAAIEYFLADQRSQTDKQGVKAQATLHFLWSTLYRAKHRAKIVGPQHNGEDTFPKSEA